MKLSKTHAAVLALIGANILWGASAPIFKWSLETIPPFTFIFIRFFLATLLLLPFVLHKMKIARQDIPKLITLAFVGFTLHITTVFFGLTLSPSINAATISASAPVFLLACSFFILRERTHKKVVIGTVTSLLGILLIIFQPLIESGLSGSLLGNLLFVAATLAFVMYTVLLKEFKLPYSALTITFWTFAFATLSFLPFYAWESHLMPPVITLQGLIGILFGAVFTSNVSYMLFNYAVKNIHTDELGIFLYIDPIAAVLIAVPLLGEVITLTFVIGAFLVFTGILIAEGRFHYHPLHLLRKS